MKNKIKLLISLLLISFCSFILQSSTIKATRINIKGHLNIAEEDSSEALNVAFRDTLNRSVRLSDFKGKFIVVDLWYSGCGACITANKGLHTVHDQLIKENIVFLSISIDQDRTKWMLSVTKNSVPSKFNPWAGKYYPVPGTIVLYTGGCGANNDFVKKYVPQNLYPQLLLISPSGQVISTHPPRPDYEPEKLIAFIKDVLANTPK
ncbi:MAG: thioredoxin-like domain-containing protein [Mucilaginibacter sp.]|uniref:TlpA family protein disulfide reductase n=1 Tax=Mucilaginibacter sp. TaxID=1882438 RepID=UPI003264E1A4